MSKEYLKSVLLALFITVVALAICTAFGILVTNEIMRVLTTGQ